MLLRRTKTTDRRELIDAGKTKNIINNSYYIEYRAYLLMSDGLLPYNRYVLVI